MKLTLCFLALLLALSSCETVFRPQASTPEAPQLSNEDPYKDVSEFYEGLFSHFGLDKPEQIINECLCPKSSAIFLQSIYAFNQILIDVNNRDAARVHLDWAKEFILAILGHGSSGCVIETQDFSDLLEALGVERDPILTNVAGWLYYQADFPKLLEDYKPVIQNLDAKNFTAAGAAYGDIMKDNVDAVKDQGVHYLSLTGMNNGFALGLEIDLPNDSLKVWNDTTAAWDLAFLFGASRAVAAGKWWESYENLVKYWNEKGEDILGNIPMEVWEDLQGSDDNKKVTEKLGVDIMTKEFEDKMLAWIKKHPLKYHILSKLLQKNFDQLHFIHIGLLQACLVKEIAKS
jgi:hypothetical protein